MKQEKLSGALNLCIYFGWKFSSPMPDIYIKRSGVNMEEIENKFKSSQMEELETEIESLKTTIQENEISMDKKLNDLLKEMISISYGNGKLRQKHLEILKERKP